MARVIKNTLMLGTLGAVAAAVAFNLQDIKRYLQIKQSSGGNHPEKIPVGGRTAYPQQAGQGDRDGTGDFDSARRGGPIRP